MSRRARPTRRVMVVGALLLGAATLAGCGGSQEPESPDDAAARAASVTSSTPPDNRGASATAGSADPADVPPVATVSGPQSAKPLPTGSPATGSRAAGPSPPAAQPGGQPVPPQPATPSPGWLGSRVLGPAGGGPVAPQVTPPELLDRRLITVDVLAPPTSQTFVADVAAVPPDVLARSTWSSACPVAASDLRYVTLPFWGFDQSLHTGEVLLHADAVDAVVAAFAAMHAERFPLEEVRVIRAAELDLAPTGDGNVTSAFVCRPVTGGSRWSDHAYGRAIDVNPFHNPYDKGAGAGRVVLPELATAYTDRDRVLPGMITPGSAVAVVFAEAGWGWGGDYRSLKDFQHFSASGG